MEAESLENIHPKPVESPHWEKYSTHDFSQKLGYSEDGEALPNRSEASGKTYNIITRGGLRYDATPMYTDSVEEDTGWHIIEPKETDPLSFTQFAVVAWREKPETPQE
jgi:hypothetical protein